MNSRGCLLALTLWTGVTAPAAAPTVSLTFDDGPSLDPTPLMTPGERNDAILTHLRDKGVQAMFFVTLKNGADRPEGRALLTRLADAHQLIANHTVTHPDFNADTTTLEAFGQEVLGCDEVIRALPGYRRFFRFPYLREGATPSKRDGIRLFLREHEYRIGYVSIDTSDWLLDRKLRGALAGNPGLDLKPWRDLHLASLWDNARAYERLARQLHGREIQHVLLLHHNLTNALFLGDVIDMFRARGWTIVSPDEAFEDAAYQVAPMLPRLDGSVLESTAQALGVSSRSALEGLRTERRLGEDADTLSALSAPGAGDAAAPGADDIAIRELQARQVDAWNRRDAAAYAGLFVEDGDVVNVLGWHWKGRGAIERNLSDAFAHVFSDSTLKVTEVSVRHLEPGVAVAHVRWEMEGARAPPGAPAPPRQGIQLQVLRKLAGRWWIVSFQNTNSVPEAPFPRATPTGSTGE